MSAKRRYGNLLLAAVFTLSIVLAAVAPAASAEGSGTACPTNRLCLYFNSNFAGARAGIHDYDQLTHPA